jgi:hypothetical protein
MLRNGQNYLMKYNLNFSFFDLAHRFGLKYTNNAVLQILDYDGNPNRSQTVGSGWNVTEKGLVENLGSGGISQLWCFCDLSDDILCSANRAIGNNNQMNFEDD